MVGVVIIDFGYKKNFRVYHGSNEFAIETIPILMELSHSRVALKID
jgi:hypothetical protein